VISLIPPGAFKDAFTVTVAPGIPAKVPEVLTVGAGKTSTSSEQLDNVPIRKLAIANSLIAFIDNRFIFVNCLNYLNLLKGEIIIPNDTTRPGAYD
jgi:hypothetical protein